MKRKVRVAIVAAILGVLGAFALSRGATAAGIVLLVIAAAIAGLFLAFVYFPSRIPRDAVLQIRLAGRLREHSSGSPWQQLLGRGFPTLYDLRQALEAARSDRPLRALIIEFAGLEIGFATACELHDLISSVRHAGKRVVAVIAGDNLTIREYLAAAGAEEIVVNPDTGMMMLGVAAGSVFVKRALDRFGIQAQTLQWKEYKGAGETLTREKMSPELRESMEAIVADWRATISEKIAASRKLDPEAAREAIGAGFLSAEAARQAKLIDRIGHPEDVEDELDPEGNRKRIVGLARYLRHLGYSRRPARARLAIVHGVGPVVAGEPPMSGEFLSGSAIASEIGRAARDKGIRAIIIRVNSPGGSAAGSELVWRATIEARRRGKPVVVSMGDVAGSGGYYVAMGADAIVAEPATITGSIGVVYTKLSVRDLIGQLGIGLEFAKSDEVSDALSVSREMTEAELAQVNRAMGELYANFTKKVSEGRKLDADSTERAARGRVWSGMAAKGLGLIDELGGLGRAIEIAREKAGIRPDEDHRLVPFPHPGILTGMRLALMPSQVPMGLAMVAEAVGVPAEWVPAIVRLLSRTGAMLWCPFF